jgi:DNA-binding NtrC family response regulator
VAVQTQNILIVEDERLVARALARALNLTRDGYVVESCGSAEEALERLNDGSFELLISDWRLPGMNGLELIKVAHQHNPSLRSLLITAFGTPQVEEQARHLSDAFLPKPFRLRDMIQTVRRVLDDSQK